MQSTVQFLKCPLYSRFLAIERTFEKLYTLFLYVLYIVHLVRANFWELLPDENRSTTAPKTRRDYSRQIKTHRQRGEISR